MRILAIDPGLSTGIAYANFENGQLPTPITEMPRGWDEAAKIFRDFLDWEFGKYRQPDLIVIERFTINSATAQKSRAGSNLAIELIGAAKYLAWLYDIPVEEQAPADAKNFADDKKLRRIKWHRPGPDHQNDALRHLLLAAVRHQQLDLAQLLP